MEINVLMEGDLTGCPAEDWLQRVAERVLISEEVAPDTELGLLVTGQERIRKLNRDYRGKDEPTDVLSFSLAEGDNAMGVAESPFVVAPDGVRHLGEVIISYPQAVIQASEHRHPVARELSILIIHGVLHLLGYDHEKAEMARQMTAKEAALRDVIATELGLSEAK